jgi:CheY-like chemotaxis protein
MGGGKPAAVRVLVVDDSPVDRKVVELLLRNHKGGPAPFHGELLSPCRLLSNPSSVTFFFFLILAFNRDSSLFLSHHHPVVAHWRVHVRVADRVD